MIVEEAIEITKISIKVSKNKINSFLKDLKSILNSKQFDINRDFLLIKNHTPHGIHGYSTPQTLVDLDYDVEDVVERLKELSIKEYSETLLDKDDNHPPYLYVFAKDINRHQVYIKLKIKQMRTKKILCVSFHYAQYEITNFPYK